MNVPNIIVPVVKSVGVDKTSFIERHCTEFYAEKYESTNGCKRYETTFHTNYEPFNVTFVDTSEQEVRKLCMVCVDNVSIQFHLITISSHFIIISIRDMNSEDPTTRALMLLSLCLMSHVLSRTGLIFKVVTRKL